MPWIGSLPRTFQFHFIEPNESRLPPRPYRPDPLPPKGSDRAAAVDNKNAKAETLIPTVSARFP